MKTDDQLRADITGWERTIATSRRMTTLYEKSVIRAQQHLREAESLVRHYKELVASEERAMRGAHWELATGHRADRHEHCDRQHCQICEGGLTICTRCGGAEGSLLPTCPERRLTFEEDQANYVHYCAGTGPFAEDEPHTNRRLAMIERRAEVAKKTKNCSYCPPHSVENKTHTSSHANVKKRGRRVRG